MALTESNMLPLGTKAPDFTLPDTVSGKKISLADVRSDKATLIMFVCNHCPYVIHLENAIADLAKVYQDKGVGVVAISSNDVDNYPLDSPELMTKKAKQAGYSFPYLYDEDQSVAKAYDAACTPDFYIFDGEMKLVYRGRFDASRPGNSVAIDGADIKAALEAILSGNAIAEPQWVSAGCNIKWKK